MAREARAAGFEQVSVSSRVSPTIKIVARGDTTVVDAYTTPVVRGYVATIRERMPGGRLRLMTSAGGLVDAAAASGKDTILSGPAGGVVALAAVTRAAGLERAIGFDMGGTSTDVSRFSGELRLRVRDREGGRADRGADARDRDGGGGRRLDLRLRRPEAGGGAAFERRRSGPGLLRARRSAVAHRRQPVAGADSAGAVPVRARRGGGGEASRRGARGDRGAHGRASRARGDRRRLRADRQRQHGGGDPAGVGGEGLRPAALRAGRVRWRRRPARLRAGPRSGDANGTDAPLRRSAVGFRHGRRRRARVRRRDGAAAARRRRAAELAPDAGGGSKTELRAKVLAQGIEPRQVAPARRLLELRYRGQSSTIAVAEPEAATAAHWRSAFEDEHRRLYGHVFDGREVEVAAARVEVTGAIDKAELPARPRASAQRRADGVAPPVLRWRVARGRGLRSRAARAGRPFRRTRDRGRVDRHDGGRAGMDGAPHRARRAAARGRAESRARPHGRPARPAGPGRARDLQPPLRRDRRGDGRHAAAHRALGQRQGAARLLVRGVRRLGVAGGERAAHAGPPRRHERDRALRAARRARPRAGRRRAHQRPVPRRLAPARHHLGDAGVRRREPLATPLFFAASRAHHAEIGGIRPGSMPPDSRTLEEEGVVLRAWKVVEGGRPRLDELRGSSPRRATRRARRTRTSPT